MLLLLLPLQKRPTVQVHVSKRSQYGRTNEEFKALIFLLNCLWTFKAAFEDMASPKSALSED